MISESGEIGLIQVLAERMETQRIPRALAIKDKVDRGGTLNEFEIQFLDEVFHDVQRVRDLIDRHPECQLLAAKAIHLYKEITTKALENEQAKRGRS